MKRKLIRRIDPRKLNPANCCFIFSSFRKDYAVFRIYNRENKTFKDYRVATAVTPFVQIVDNDIELKEYIGEDGEVEYLMDFPEHALTCGETPLLKPGEVWEAEDIDGK